MRFLSKPASGKQSGNTLIAHQEPPSRNGASHNSQAKPTTIRPNKLKTATQRVSAMREDGVGVCALSVLKVGLAGVAVRAV